MRRVALSIALTISCCAAVISFAAAQSSRRGRTVDIGMANGKALRMGIPAYPLAARSAGVHGQVEVRVLINQTGEVVNSTGISGPRLLRNAAARAAKFSVFPSNVGECKDCRYFSGILVYKFNPIPPKP
jgi:outer membrane biosynthesis protein TonB